MIPIAKPLIGEEEKRAVQEVLDSGMLAQGSKVKEFEEAFAKFIGVKHAIATANGTAALHTTLLANDIKNGDEVITTPFTFIATANSIRMVGATPVFVDIDNSFNLNPEQLEEAITERTKAVMVVHLFGKSAQLNRIAEICKKHNLLLIEDACQAHGATFNGQKVGSFGTGCFSFYPTKNMTTSEGGIITTNDDLVAKKARWLISHGAEKKYTHPMFGYNYRMTNIAAAIGIEQLKKLNYFNTKRKDNAYYLSERLSSIKGLVVPILEEGHVFHQYTLRITPDLGKTREEVIDYLSAKGIGSSVFYPIPIHQQGVYVNYNKKSFPTSEKMAREVISIPIHPSVTEDNLDYIVKAFRELFERNEND